MFKLRPILLAGCVILLTAGPLAAQDLWRVDFRGDIALAVNDPGDSDLAPGFGIEANLARQVMPHLSVYGGWGWHRFSTNEPFEGIDGSFEETSLNLGLMFIHPLAELAFDYYLRFGLVFNDLEVENESGTITGGSESVLGLQIGAGVVLPLGGEWDLMPGVRFRSFGTDIVILNSAAEADLSYVSFGASLSRKF